MQLDEKITGFYLYNHSHFIVANLLLKRIRIGKSVDLLTRKVERKPAFLINDSNFFL